MYYSELGWTHWTRPVAGGGLLWTNNQLPKIESHSPQPQGCILYRLRVISSIVQEADLALEKFRRVPKLKSVI